MQARGPDGLADDSDVALWQFNRESASPTRSGVHKSPLSQSRFSLVSDHSSVNSTSRVTLHLEARRSTTSLTQYRADHRQPASTDHQSERKRRSRKPGKAVRRRAAGGRGRSTQRNVARNDRRAPRGGRTRSSDQQRGLALDLEGRAHWVTEGNPSEGGCCRGLRCCSRWSA